MMVKFGPKVFKPRAARFTFQSQSILCNLASISLTSKNSHLD